MHKYVTEHEFIREFKEWETYKDNSSYNGLKRLYEYFEEIEEIEEQTEVPYMLDVVAICCEYKEYRNARECTQEYVDTIEDEELAREWLEEKTTVLHFDGGIIIAQF